MVLGIQYLVLDLSLGEHLAEELGYVYGNGTYQNRLSVVMSFNYLFHQGIVLGLLGSVDGIRHVLSDDRLVGWNLRYSHVVDRQEFLFFCLGRTGHAAQLVVKTEKVLICNGSQSCRFLLDWNVFLSFDGLMQTVGEYSALHDTAGKLVNDVDLSVSYQILDLIAHGVVCLQGLIDVVHQLSMIRGKQVVYLEELFSLEYTNFSQGY